LFFLVVSENMKKNGKIYWNIHQIKNGKIYLNIHERNDVTLKKMERFIGTFIKERMERFI